MNGRRRAASLAAAIGLSCFAGIAISNLYTSSHEPNNNQAPTLRSYRRALSNVDHTILNYNHEHGRMEPVNAATITDAVFKDPKHLYGDCEIPKARFATHQVATLYQPAFPGSGSRMTYELVEALTGQLGHSHVLFYNLISPSSNTILTYIFLHLQE